MNLQKTTYRFISYLFTLVLFVGLACSSDDNTVEDELPTGALTMKIDGELWTADEAYVSGFGGEEVWGEEEEELYLIWIYAIKYLDDTENDMIAETLNIGMFLDPSMFQSPNGTYPIPPPNDETDLMTVGYASATLQTQSSVYAATSDLYEEYESLGTLRITDFKIGQYFIYSDVYTHLSGTFELSMMDIYGSGGIEITEGRFNLSPASIMDVPSAE